METAFPVIFGFESARFDSAETRPGAPHRFFIRVFSRETHPTAERWHTIGINQEKQIPAWWRDIAVGWRGSVHLSRCSSVDHATDIALILVKRMSDRTRSKQDDFSDRGR
jgi:hypothetical protein